MFLIRDVWLDYGRLKDDARTHYVASRTPMISWSAMSDDENDRQSACRILVDDGRLWDSGWIETDEQSVRYGGSQLPEGVRISLKIQIRNARGIASGVHDTYFYYAGVQWRAGWIGADTPDRERPVYLRREIEVRPGLTDACLYACGVGYHKVFVNGEAIDDAKMDPAFTDYTRQCQYVMFPGLEGRFGEGRNCLGVIVAPGWRYNAGVKNLIGREASFSGDVELSAMLRLRYNDGIEEWVCTDESWEAGTGGYTFATVFDGTVYDAREERAGWNLAGFRGFSPAAAKAAPGGEMRPMTLEKIRACRERAPIAVWTDGKDAVVMDFGQNLAGTARVTLPGGLEPGKRITLTFSEELTEDGRLFRDTLRSAKAEDVYIASGSDAGEWEAEFTYHGFKYARLEGLGAGYDAARGVRALEIRTDLDNRSFFRCGNALVTKIHEACVETERGNMHGILTDCPQRDERMGWLNDATVRFEETPYNFDVGRMFAKITRDVMDLQAESGGIACTAPFIFGSNPADPVCSSFLIAGYESVMHLGSRDIIREAFESYEAWENCLLEHSDGYIVNYSYYGDWAGPLYACVPNKNGAPGAVSAVTPGIFMSTGYSYLNCELLGRFAEWLGMPEKKEKYDRLAAKISSAMLEKWYDASSGRMATGSQACQAFSLWLGIIPEDGRAKAAKLMRDDLAANDYNFTTGNLCTRYLMDALTECGYDEDAWKLITKETYPSFGYMIRQEATTIWERFELMKDASMNSHNHPMYAAVDHWMYAHLIGARPTAPGWVEFEVEPRLPEELQSVQAVIDTIRGEVSIRVVKRYEGTHLQLSVPFGCRAKVRFGGKEYAVGSGFHSFG